MNSLPFVCLALLVAVFITVANAGEAKVHVHEHTPGNDEFGDNVDSYIPHDSPVLPYEVSADQKRYEDDPDVGADDEDDH